MVKKLIKRSLSVVAAVIAVLLIVAVFVGCSKTQTRAEHAVVFFSDGGSTVASQTVYDGDKVVKPADPVKKGCIFDGWYADLELVKAWQFDKDTVTADTVLYAKWKAADGSSVEVDNDRCIIMFFENGGSHVEPLSVSRGDKITLPQTPVKQGMIFDGWYKDKNFTELWKFDTDTVTQKSTILYAKWIPDPSGSSGGNTGGDNGNNGDNGDGDNTGGNTPDIPVTGDNVTVTFNVGLDARKSGLSNPPAVTLKRGGKVVQPTVSLAGSTLRGWYAEDGAVAWNFASDTVGTNTTLYARWTSSGDRVDYTPTVAENNTLYIHYLRAENDYNDWYIYNWGNGASQEINEYFVDVSGAVYALDLTSAPCYGQTTIDFIVTQPGWVKDGGDCAVTLSKALKVGGSYHWFVREGETANGTNYLVSVSSGGDNVKTEDKRASVADVDRSVAANLPVMKTATDCDEMGVGYQIFVASFCDSNNDGVGDLRGIISKLDYIQSLNVDVLWLTPIQSSNSYHGYDCYDYYAIDPKFGTNADYRELVYKAHQKGIKVIMDLVVNHTSPNNEWFIKSKRGVIETVTYQDGTKAEVKYRDFYRWSDSSGNRKYSSGDGWYFYSSFGSNMPELNYDCQAVRNAMADVAAYWMNFGLDGFRLDAIKHIFMWDESDNAQSDAEGGANDGNWNFNLTKDVEVFKEFNHKLKSKYPQCFILGEQLSGNAAEVAPFYTGMDSLFDFNTYYDLPSNITSGNVDKASNAFNSNARLYEQYRADRPINSMISSNHDIPRLSSKLDTQQTKLYFAVTMTLPGLNWIYYGDEIGLIGVGGNDKYYRQSMKWTSDWANGCQNDISGKDLNGRTVSVAEQERDGDSLLSYVRSLGTLRNAHPALISGTATCSTQDGMLKITVVGKTETLVVYHNFSGTSKSVNGNIVFGNSTVGAYGTTVVKQ